jgi:hypothetical protein
LEKSHTLDERARRGLTALTVIAALLPGLVCLAGLIFDVPGQNRIIGCSSLVGSILALSLLLQYRYSLAAGSRKRRNCIVLICIAAFLIFGPAFLFLEERCVVEHPGFRETLVFPIWSTGKLEAMIERAGSRYQAVDRYGPAAVYDAMSSMPAWIFAVTRLAFAATFATSTIGLALTLGLLALRGEVITPFRGSDQPARTDWEFDVFLCHNSADKPFVRELALGLRQRNVRPFFDEEENPPGQIWLDYVEAAIRQCKAMAVLIGPSGIGAWQRVEITALLHERVRRGCAVIPIFLSTAHAPSDDNLPLFMSGLTWIDFRKPMPDPWAHLVRGIHGGARP